MVLTLAELSVPFLDLLKLSLKRKGRAVDQDPVGSNYFGMIQIQVAKYFGTK